MEVVRLAPANKSFAKNSDQFIRLVNFNTNRYYEFSSHKKRIFISFIKGFLVKGAGFGV